MIVKTKAIVLKNTNYSESSVISKMYTREFGLRTYIFQSIRKGKSAVRLSMIQPLSLVEIDVYEKNNANIQRVKELRNSPMLLSIQGDIVKKSIAMFMTEVVNMCITEELCEEELFDFLESTILEIEDNAPDSLFPSRFLLNLGLQLGIEPQGECTEFTPYFNLDEGIFVPSRGLHSLDERTSKRLSELKHNKHPTKFTKQDRQDVLDSLIKYYQYHIIKDKKIKSVEILSELLS